jgi:fumarate reductase subunit D
MARPVRQQARRDNLRNNFGPTVPLVSILLIPIAIAMWVAAFLLSHLEKRKSDALAAKLFYAGLALLLLAAALKSLDF